jgi:hypothetical protein
MRNKRNLQGRVEVPTGGKHYASPRAPQLRVSRFGEKPKPTVRVRIKEDERL